MIIKNCRLVPFLTQSGAPLSADVVVNGNKIESILPCGTGAEGDHQVLDIKGATLMPGLIDTHVHLFMGKRNELSQDDRITIPTRRAFDAYEYATWFLDNGYTTIRDVGDTWEYPAIALRDAVNEGGVVGPRIYGSGVTIVPVTAGFDSSAFFCAFYSTADEVRKEARRQFNHGANFLKIYGTGSMLVDDSLPGRRIMMEDEIAEAVMIARSKDSYVSCHCHGAEAIGVMIDHGVRTIEHASFITEDSCRKIDGRKDVGIVPTVACSCPEALGLSPDSGAVYERFARISDQRDACIKSAYENHDILIGWGTDMSIGTMKATPYIEWEVRERRLGCKNEDLLKQATINSAILMGVDDKIGAIAPGKFADLIVVDGDPVADIKAMHQKPLHVIKDGVLIR